MSVIKPRRWQVDASAVVVPGFLRGQRHFLVEAGVGSGKTMFSMLVYKALSKHFDKVVCVAPQYSVKAGFKDTYALAGIQVNHLEVPRPGDGFHGAALTYQGLLTADRIRAYVDKRTMVVLDEPHHLTETEDSAWYNAAKKLLSHAGMILSMTGTPFRDGDDRIPFARYEDDGDGLRLVPDYTYSYGDSVRDGVTAKVRFRFCAGDAVIKKPGARKVTRLRSGGAMDTQTEGFFLKSLLDPSKNFTRDMMAASLEELREVRETGGIPDAALLVVCVDIKHTKLVSGMLRGMGVAHEVVTGDDSTAQRQIENFRKSKCPVLVSVKMVSEGTDIRRIKGVCYLSNVRTPLFLTQVMGRAVRKVLPEDVPEGCFMVLPDVPSFKRWAATVERGMRHVVAREEELEEEEEGGAGDAMIRENRPKGAFEIISADMTGEMVLELFGGFEPSTAMPRADRVEGLRKLLADMGKQFGVKMATAHGADVGEMIRQVNVQSNSYVGAAKQEEMTAEQLAKKLELLQKWYDENGMKVPEVQEGLLDG